MENSFNYINTLVLGKVNVNKLYCLSNNLNSCHKIITY